jgi:hypothetical protein
MRRGFGEAPHPASLASALIPSTAGYGGAGRLGKPTPKTDRVSTRSPQRTAGALAWQTAAPIRAVARRKLCAVSHLYSAPRHVVLSRRTFWRFVTPFKPLESGSCTIVYANFGELPLHALGCVCKVFSCTGW